MKFGGTSVADEAAFRRVTAIVREQLARRTAAERPPVVVVSALSKITDGLLHVARLTESDERRRALDRLEELAERHVRIATAMTSGARLAAVTEALRGIFAATSEIVRAHAPAHELSPRLFDAIASTGELASSRLMAAALSEAGVATTWVDARQVIVTDAEHLAAQPDMTASCACALRHIGPVLTRGEVAVLGGFIGATADGVTTTLGRGGSDYSAAIVGACLEAREIQIWTDVDGMLTADPRVVPRPRLVPRLSFAEASELAYFGAKVLHPSTILPAVSKNIPVRILNSVKPDRPGTLIASEPDAAGGHVTAIACKRGATVIDITSTRMFMRHGFLRRVFEVFERFKTPVDVVTTSEVSVSVTIDDARRLEAILGALREFADVACEPEMAIICAVGEDVHQDPRAFGRAISAIDAIPLRMVSQAASRRNMTFVLRDAEVPAAMARLHDEFFGRS
jgi:aspartate kinase